ncbi:MAG: hypothetical protein CMJ84_12195 [Planctomycetes bacterium]|jgi:hypothetical protein|nr:hypothetical protein [Planctomycetota bacterium]MDP6407890.1 hypothetical protein [Planctomycetota bacterium]
MHSSTWLRRALAPCATLALASVAFGQATFSVDHGGSTRSAMPSFGANPITEGDLLMSYLPIPTMGPLAAPGIRYHGGPDLGLTGYGGCIGLAPGVPCTVEVDAVSYGTDFTLGGTLPLEAGMVWYSVDRGSAGISGLGYAPNVNTESPVDASADVFLNAKLGLPPWGPAAPTSGLATIDGDGQALNTIWGYPGFGLIESGTSPDNLDAFDVETDHSWNFPVGGIYFSLDAGYMTGGAAAHGFAGGDVLHVSMPGTPPGVYAMAAQLGLDHYGIDSDDLDALCIAENGVPGYQPSMVHFDWLTGQTDMVLFSVRKGSAVIGTVDGGGAGPIEPGDILSAPLNGTGPPTIFIAAENLGLCTSIRPSTCGGAVDDLDALDITEQPQGLIESRFCFCPAPAAPRVADPLAGCANSTGVGGRLEPTGSSSVGGSLALTASDLPPFQFGIVFMGSGNVLTPFGDGQRCVAPSTTGIYRYGILNSGAGGSYSVGNVVAHANATFPAPGHINAGDTWLFQSWFRDPAAWATSATFNLTNAVSVHFRP